MIRRNKKASDFKTVGQIIPRAIKHLTQSPEYKFYLIKFYWENIVGEEIAAHAAPKNFAFGVLYIGTSSSVWANNLLYMKFDIMTKINNSLKYSLIKDIKFTYGKMGGNKDIPVKIKEKRNIKRMIAATDLSSMDINKINLSCSKINDNDLAESIKKVLVLDKKVNKIKKMNKWHKCQKCGTLCPDDDNYCSNCKRENKNDKDYKIRKILMIKPWARYSEIKNYVAGCSQRMVNDARTSLVQKMAANLKISLYDDMQIKTLVMLYKALPPEQINDRVVEDNINRLKYDLMYNERQKIIKRRQ